MEQEERLPEDPQGQQEAPEEEAASAPDSVEASLEEALRERDQFRAMAQRAQADFINYKRRTEEERQDLVRNATSLMALQLLPIVDDLERSLEHLPPEAPDSWSEGVKMILRKLQALLEAEGVTGFEPEPGTSLDPAEHDAVFYEATDQYPPGAVVNVVRQGYRMNNRVLRPAQVTVAQVTTEEEPADDASSGTGG